MMKMKEAKTQWVEYFPVNSIYLNCRSCCPSSVGPLWDRHRCVPEGEGPLDTGGYSLHC